MFKIISEIFICIGIVSALIITVDIIRHPQKEMPIMNLVWPINGLWAGPFCLLAYFTIGKHRKMDMSDMKGMDMPHMSGMDMGNMDMKNVDMPKMKGMDMSNMDMSKENGMGMKIVDMPHMNGMDMGNMDMSKDKSMDMSNMDMTNMKGMDIKSRDMPHVNGMDMSNMDMKGSGNENKPSKKKYSSFWQGVVADTLHCGAGCSLADLIGPWIFLVVPFTIFNNLTFGEWVLDYCLALLTGVTFQYAAISPMMKKKGLKVWLKALKIDFFSLTSWQIGMYGFMALVIFVWFGRLSPTTPEFWFMMQIAMCFGFVTAYPVNWILVKKGIKMGM
ncbi:DUF4396 domain-containing protein [Clostridium sp. LY3-2]|uniref:DUF4396 domain-containing protein n=1 Tax=Clostridium sp. LY3-2 TaxID=2942482 RepID=UPI0021525B8A|nr:DUF4396 domain-containing protein [Clostridium sp. LY3-2]MCR6514415.1 DUF4396 domain-containing protein [Clostridium sp. LY3-2]